MKNKILGSIAVLAIAIAIAINVNLNSNNDNGLSSVSLANLEALANENDYTSKLCESYCFDYQYSTCIIETNISYIFCPQRIPKPGVIFWD